MWYYGDHSGYGLGQAETTSKWNVDSHWLSHHPKCYLHGYIWGNVTICLYYSTWMDWNVPVSRSNGAPLLNTTSSPEIAHHCSKFHRSLSCKRDNDEIRFVQYDNTIISISSFHNAVWLYWYWGYVSIWEPIKHINLWMLAETCGKKPVLLLPRPIEPAGDQPVTCNNSPEGPSQLKYVFLPVDEFPLWR